MNTRLALCALASLWAAPHVHAQAYVTPMLGGGQVAANMLHIDLSYDAEADLLSAHVDDSEGAPQLRPLVEGEMFDPAADYAVLNGKAYNAQYGWNPSGFWTVPQGAAIWIELTGASPGLEIYEEFGVFGGGSYSPIFGTAGSPLIWRWAGRMVHNVSAVRTPNTDRYSADYHIYFGDPATGARRADLDHTFVHLEWTAVPMEDPLTFKFGAVALTNRAPLSFLDADSFATNTDFVLNLQATNGGPGIEFERAIPLIALAATAANGGPEPNHASLGSCLELEIRSLTGPAGARLRFWAPGATTPAFALGCGAADGTNRIRLSQGSGAPGADPFGRIPGLRLKADQPGLYCLGFRAVDTSTNGVGGGPIHAPSPVCHLYLQAGLTIAALERQAQSATISFGGESGKMFYLERATALGPPGWQTVTGPLTGTNRLQRLTDPAATNNPCFYRLRAQTPPS